MSSNAPLVPVAQSGRILTSGSGKRTVERLALASTARPCETVREFRPHALDDVTSGLAGHLAHVAEAESRPGRAVPEPGRRPSRGRSPFGGGVGKRPESSETTIRSRSGGDPHEQCERAVHGQHVGVVEVSEDFPQAARSCREDLVDHDVGAPAQTVSLGGFDRHAHQGDVECG